MMWRPSMIKKKDILITLMAVMMVLLVGCSDKSGPQLSPSSAIHVLVPEICPPYNPVTFRSSRQAQMINTRTRPFIFILISAFALILVAPSHLTLFTWSDQGLVESFAFSFELTFSPASSTDLDRDG